MTAAVIVIVAAFAFFAAGLGWAQSQTRRLSVAAMRTPRAKRRPF